MYQKVLIPLDGSELAECSLEHAKTIIPACHVADVVVLQVVVPFSVQTMPALGEADDDALSRIREQNQKDAEEYVLKVKDTLKKQGIATRAVTVVGNPADEILGYTEKKQRRLDGHEHSRPVGFVAVLLRKRSGKGVPPFPGARLAHSARRLQKHNCLRREMQKW